MKKVRYISTEWSQKQVNNKPPSTLTLMPILGHVLILGVSVGSMSFFVHYCLRVDGDVQVRRDEVGLRQALRKEWIR